MSTLCIFLCFFPALILFVQGLYCMSWVTALTSGTRRTVSWPGGSTIQTSSSLPHSKKSLSCFTRNLSGQFFMNCAGRKSEQRSFPSLVQVEDLQNVLLFLPELKLQIQRILILFLHILVLVFLLYHNVMSYRVFCCFISYLVIKYTLQTPPSLLYIDERVHSLQQQCRVLCYMYTQIQYFTLSIYAKLGVVCRFLLILIR